MTAIPVITAPVAGTPVTASPTTMRWTASDQTSYQIRRVPDIGGVADTATLLYDSGEVVTATARSQTVSVATDDRYEHLQVRVRGGDGTWSGWADVRIYTSYDPPPTPTLSLATDDTTASITVVITNPAPGDGQVATVTNQLYRRAAGEAAGVRVATALSPAALWVDYTPASGVDYSYQVVATGGNGLTTSSAWTSVALSHDPTAFPSVGRFPSASLFPAGLA